MECSNVKGDLNGRISHKHTRRNPNLNDRFANIAIIPSNTLLVNTCYGILRISVTSRSGCDGSSVVLSKQGNLILPVIIQSGTSGSLLSAKVSSGIHNIQEFTRRLSSAKVNILPCAQLIRTFSITVWCNDAQPQSAPGVVSRHDDMGSVHG